METYEISSFFEKAKLFLLMLIPIMGIVGAFGFAFKSEFKYRKFSLIFVIPFYFLLAGLSGNWEKINDNVNALREGEISEFEGVLVHSEFKMLRGLMRDSKMYRDTEVSQFMVRDGRTISFYRVSPKTRSGGPGCLKYKLAPNIEEYYGKLMKITYKLVDYSDSVEPVKCVLKVEVFNQ